MKAGFKEKAAAVILLIIVAVFAVYSLFWEETSVKIAENNEKTEEIKSRITNLSELRSQKETLEERDKELAGKIEELKKDNIKVNMSSEEFMMFFSQAAEQAGTEVVNYISGSEKELNDITEKSYAFEVRGTIGEINRLLKTITAEEIKYSVGSVSMRQDSEHEYLARYFDNATDLKWYKYENKPEKENKEDEEKPSAENRWRENGRKYNMYLTIEMITDAGGAQTEESGE